MTQAINSAKGKSIEALISQALMECRAADRAAGSPCRCLGGVPANVRSRTREVSRTETSNSRPSRAPIWRSSDTWTAGWVDASIPRIFPASYPRNSVCAVDGLAYTPFAREIYRLLITHGVIDRALRYELKGRVANEKLLERIALRTCGKKTSWIVSGSFISSGQTALTIW